MDATQIDANTPGTALGEHYELLALLGRGGFGTVFKATQCSTGQPVAIKVQRLDAATKAGTVTRAARFEREAKLCAALSHPNIVRLVDRGQNDAYQYLVFEFVHGETLAQLLARGGALPPHDCVALAGQVLEALDSAHAQGIVHRDLKPENIMVIGSGTRRQIKILDFGVGAFVSRGRDLRITVSREIVGTPCYAAPEQLRGEPATPRSDIYAWGLVLLECLTGRRVMDGATAAHVFHKQLSAAPIPLPPALAAHPLGDILRRALTKNARERTPTAGQLWTDLQRVRVSDLVGPLAVDVAARPPGARTAGLDAAEQRQVTVLSCNLMVFPRQDAEHDIEALDAIQHDQLSLCSDTLSHFGGSVVGALANRIIAAFGLPVADDSDPRRAGRAALEISARIESRRVLLAQRGVDLELRIGLHTGLVIVNADGQPSGLALNVATRLESVAPAGTLLASRVVRDLLRRHLAFVAHESDGAAGRAEVYRLVGEAAPHAPYDLPGQTSALELVGRTEEFDQLLRHWQQAHAGNGRVVALQGEPGIGKSRLALELCAHVRALGAQSFEFHCLPEDSNSALAPVLPVVRQCFELGAERTPASLARLAEALAATAPEVEGALPVFRTWLSIDAAADPTPSALSPEAQRELLLRTLAKWLSQPDHADGVLLLVEDLHWADPTTLDLLERMSASIASSRVLIAITSRNEVTLGGAHRINLTGLAAAAATKLVRSLVSGAGLEDSAVADIVAHTDGVPLFIEELTRDWQAARQQRRRGERPIPASLRDVLGSRLDGLGPAKETAQLAAAIGREFDMELVRATSLRNAEDLQADLNLMVDAGLVRQQLQAAGARYAFRHALIRDAASQSMLSHQRRTIHRCVALALETRSNEQRDAARLARHYELAGETDLAIKNRLAAAQVCALASAYKEAIEHLKAGLGLLPLVEPERQVTSEIELRNTLGAILITAQGFAADEVVATFTRSDALIQTGAGSPAQRFASLRGLWTFHNARAEIKAAQRLSEQLLELASQEAGVGAALVANDCAGQTAFLRGRFREVVSRARLAVAETDLDAARDRVLRYGVDPRTSSLSFAGLANLLLGEVAACDAFMAHASAAVQQLRSPAQESRLLGQLAVRYILEASCAPRPNPSIDAALRLAGEALDKAQRYGVRFGEGYARVLLAMCGCLDGREDAVRDMARAVQVWKLLGLRGSLSWYYAYLAQGHLARAEIGEARSALQAACDHCEQTSERYGASEVQRVLGLLWNHAHNPERQPGEARRAFLTALDIAQEQGARWLELRAAYTLATSFPRDDLARGKLQRVVHGFSDEPAALRTPLLQAARTWLNPALPRLVAH